MSYYHVIAKVGADEEFKSLFSDLSEESLRKQFLRPYENGNSFFSGNDLISPAELRSLHIIKTDHPDQIERAEINRKDMEKTKEMNNSNLGFFIVGIGGGYDPLDIVEAGDDLTHDLISGPPGSKSSQWSFSKNVIGWFFGIVATIVGAGIVKLLGWL